MVAISSHRRTIVQRCDRRKLDGLGLSLAEESKQELSYLVKPFEGKSLSVSPAIKEYRSFHGQFARSVFFKRQSSCSLKCSSTTI